MAGIAATALSTTTDVYRLGKLDSADPIPYDLWIQATRQAAGDMGLAVALDEETEPGVWRMLLQDERRGRIKIRVERHAEHLTRTRIDVGFFGSEPTARLLIDQIRRGVVAASTGADRGPVWGWGSVPGSGPATDPTLLPHR